jgi:LacI family transcriptional regulator
MTPIRFSSGGTLRDVADAAGVSLSTASRVLNGGKPVSDELAKQVLAAAKRVGYAPHRLAQALRGRSDTICMIVDDPTTPTMAETVAAMQAEAKSVGAVVTVAASGSDPRHQLASVRTLTALRPRAVVLSGAWLYDPQLTEALLAELREYESRGGHVVVLGRSRLPQPAIHFDDHAMGMRMAEHVSARHRRPVLVLAGPVDHPALAARTRGFQEGLVASGFNGADITVVHTPVSRIDAAMGVARYCDRRTPAAVMSANDVLALGALAELSRRDIRVPGDVILTGIDDIPLARDADPPLTTIALPFAEVGRTALRLALEPVTTADNVLFSGRLIPRASTEA